MSFVLERISTSFDDVFGSGRGFEGVNERFHPLGTARPLIEQLARALAAADSKRLLTATYSWEDRNLATAEREAYRMMTEFGRGDEVVLQEAWDLLGPTLPGERPADGRSRDLDVIFHRACLGLVAWPALQAKWGDGAIYAVRLLIHDASQLLDDDIETWL